MWWSILVVSVFDRLDVDSCNELFQAQLQSFFIADEVFKLSTVNTKIWYQFLRIEEYVQLLRLTSLH